MSLLEHVSFLKAFHLAPNDHQPELTIAFALDRYYLKPCGICINSIGINNPDTSIDFYILTDHFDTAGFDANCFAALIQKFNKFRIYIYQIQQDDALQFQTNARFPKAMYYRFILPELLKDKVSQFVYLDADIICDRSLDELCQVDLGKHIIAAVEDPDISVKAKAKIGLNSASRYFNSGVQIINIENWLNFNTFNQFKQVILSQKFNYPDQDALNIVLEGRVKFIQQKFNDTHQLNNNRSVFVHYISSPKPWTLAADFNPRYQHYYAASPWAAQNLDLPRNYRDTKKLSYRFWQQANYILACKWFLIYLLRRIAKAMRFS